LRGFKGLDRARRGTDDGRTKGNTRIWQNQEEVANPSDEAENVKLLVNHFLKQRRGFRSPIMSISTLWMATEVLNFENIYQIYYFIDSNIKWKRRKSPRRTKDTKGNQQQNIFWTLERFPLGNRFRRN